MILKGHNYSELLCDVGVFTKFFFFYSNVTKDLKHSLPSGLGLSETQITSHGFDSTREGVIEAGTYQGKRPHILNTAGVERGEFLRCCLCEESTKVQLFHQR
jgi:hypothetical protein